MSAEAQPWEVVGDDASPYDWFADPDDAPSPTQPQPSGPTARTSPHAPRGPQADEDPVWPHHSTRPWPHPEDTPWPPASPQTATWPPNPHPAPGTEPEATPTTAHAAWAPQTDEAARAPQTDDSWGPQSDEGWAPRGEGAAWAPQGENAAWAPQGNEAARGPEDASRSQAARGPEAEQSAWAGAPEHWAAVPEDETPEWPAKPVVPGAPPWEPPPAFTAAAAGLQVWPAPVADPHVMPPWPAATGELVAEPDPDDPTTTPNTNAPTGAQYGPHAGTQDGTQFGSNVAAPDDSQFDPDATRPGGIPKAAHYFDPEAAKRDAAAQHATTPIHEDLDFIDQDTPPQGFHPTGLDQPPAPRPDTRDEPTGPMRTTQHVDPHPTGPAGRPPEPGDVPVWPPAPPAEERHPDDQHAPGHPGTGQATPGHPQPRTLEAGTLGTTHSETTQPATNRPEAGHSGGQHPGGHHPENQHPGGQHPEHQHPGDRTAEHQPSGQRPEEHQYKEHQHGEHRPGEQHAGEQRAGEQRAGEQQPGEQRPGEHQHGGQQHSEQRAKERRLEVGRQEEKRAEDRLPDLPFNQDMWGKRPSTDLATPPQGTPTYPPGAFKQPPFQIPPPPPPPKGKSKRALLVTLGALALAGVATGGFFAYRALSTTQPTATAAAQPTTAPQPSADLTTTTSPPTSGAPGASVLNSEETDPQKLSLTEAFPKKKVTAAGMTFTRVKTDVETDCEKAASGAFADALDEQKCSRIVRATYVDSKRRYAVTTGIAVLPTKEAAEQADQAKNLSRNVWFRPLPGPEGSGGERVHIAGGYAAGLLWGRYIVFSYATHSDGHTPEAKEKTLTKVSGAFRDQTSLVLERRATKG